MYGTASPRNGGLSMPHASIVWCHCHVVVAHLALATDLECFRREEGQCLGNLDHQKTSHTNHDVGGWFMDWLYHIPRVILQHSPKAGPLNTLNFSNSCRRPCSSPHFRRRSPTALKLQQAGGRGHLPLKVKAV